MRRNLHGPALAGVRNLIHSLGGRCWRTSQGGGMMRRGGRAPVMQDAGIPDLWCIIPYRGAGRGSYTFWVEVKAGKDRLSQHQKDFIDACAENGMPVVVGDVTDVAEFLGVKLT